MITGVVIRRSFSQSWNIVGKAIQSRCFASASEKYPFFGICNTPFYEHRLREHIQSTWGEDYIQKAPIVVSKDAYLGREHSFKTPQGEPPFNLDNFYDKLHTRTMGQTLLYCHELTSTQSILKDMFKDYQSGIVCIADKQTQGKGRSKNKWDSPYGCLMFSFKTYIEQSRDLPLLQYLVALTLTNAVEAVYKTEAKQMGIAIKWPNDIFYHRDKKIAGIICQSVYNGRAFDITVGCGVNISNSLPTTCIKDIAQKLKIENYDAGRSSVLAAFCNEFAQAIQTFRKYGFEPFMSDYMDAWLHSNEEVTVVSDEDPNVTKAARIRGINSMTGMLEAVDKEGDVIELYPDTHSLNLMDRLIYRKK